MAGPRKDCMVCFGTGKSAIGNPCHECYTAAPVPETAEVIELGGHANMTVDQALDMVKRAGTAKIVIIGYRSDGRFFKVNSSMTNEAMMWLLEVAKYSLIEDAQNAQNDEG